MAVKCYISEEKQVKVIRIISKDGVGPGINAAIDRITSLEGGLSAASGGIFFKNYALGPENPALNSGFLLTPGLNMLVNGRVIWVGKEIKLCTFNPSVYRKPGTMCDGSRSHCAVDLVTRYPVTLAVLQYLTGNKEEDYELELFKLFLSQNSSDTNGLELERSFKLLEEMILKGVDKEYLMYMIREMYPDLYHFVIDVMPFVDVRDGGSFDDNIFNVSPGKAQNNARGLKLVRQLHKIANGSNN